MDEHHLGFPASRSARSAPSVGARWGCGNLNQPIKLDVPERPVDFGENHAPSADGFGPKGWNAMVQEGLNRQHRGARTTPLLATAICLLTLGAIAGKAQTLTSTFQFTGSGTFGTVPGQQQQFTNAAIIITTVSNVPPPVVVTGNFPNTIVTQALISDSASLSISGFGTSQFTVPTSIRLINGPGIANALTFGGPSGNLLTMGASAISNWNMSSSIGPIELLNELVPSSMITTTTGILNLYNISLIVLQATVSGTPPPPVLTRTGVLSHIAANGGWTTVITLINTSSAALPVTVGLHNGDGSAMTLPVTTIQQGVSETATTASVNGTINPNATFEVSIGGQTGTTVVGWADVLSSGSLAGYAIFRSTPQTGSPSEGTVSLQSQSPTTMTLPYDNTASFVMGVALANLSASSANVTATMWDSSGNELGVQVISIAGSGHTSFVLPAQFPVTAGKLGIVQFQAAGGIAGLGLRFSPFGTFTSVPTM